jgi:hypothetical protein
MGKVWLLAGLLLAALPGCCNPACREENLPEHRDRATPLRSVQFFQYAIRNDCMGLAYDTLTEEDREQVARWKFRLFFCTVDYPGTDISICEMIKDFEPWAGGVSVKGQEAIVLGESRNMFIQVALVEKDGAWDIDAAWTMHLNQPK